MVFRPGQGPMDQTRETQRQAEIRELYGKVSRLEEYINTNVQVQAEAPQPIVLSPVVNYLDNSDFRLSVSEMNTGTTITDPCTILDKWYQSANLTYELHDYASATGESANAITETSDDMTWEPFNGVVILNGGGRLASPLFDNFASSGNTLSFRMRLIHRPKSPQVLEYGNDGVFTIGFRKSDPGVTADVFDSLEVNQLIYFFQPSVQTAQTFTKPDGIGFFQIMRIASITVPAPPDDDAIYGGVDYYVADIELKEYQTEDAVTYTGTYTYDGTNPLMILATRPIPDITIKVAILEGTSGTLEVLSENDDGTGTKAELTLANTFQNISSYTSLEIVGTLVVPTLENPFNRGRQWLQISFMNGSSLADGVDIPNGTIWIDNVALSSAYGSWSPSFRDSAFARTCSRTAPGDLESIIGGGGGGIVALPPPPDGGGIEEPYLPGIPQLPPPTRGGTF